VLEGNSTLSADEFAYNKDGAISKIEHNKFVYDDLYNFKISFYFDGTCRFSDVETGDVFHSLVSEYVIELHKVLVRGTVSIHGETHRLNISK